MLMGAALQLQAVEPARWLIAEHGAVGDGVTVNTKAIQATIEECAASGGGEVVVSPGVFVSGALYFKQGVNLRIEKDGVLKSTTEMADFPPIYTRWQGIERYWTSAFLNFVGMTNVEVTGEGLIDGSGTEFGGGTQLGNSGRGQPATKATEAASAAAGAGQRGSSLLPKPADVYPLPLPVTYRICFATNPARLPVINAAGVAVPRGSLSPPRTLVFQNCENVRVSGVNVLNQARWAMVFIYCDNVVAENLTIRNPQHNIPSSDCMDIDSSRHVRVTGCTFECNDDCISIKAGKDEDGLRVNRPSEDIVIEKTRFAYGHGGVAMGSEVSGGIRRVEVRDCVVEAGNWAPIRFKSQPSRGGVVEDIVYRNIEIRDARQAVEFNLEWRMVPPLAPPARVLTQVRNVQLINVTGTANSVGVLHGLKDSPITGVRFENCRLTAQRGLVLENTRDIDTSGLKLDVKSGDPIMDRNVR
jgi:polygalacturonase